MNKKNEMILRDFPSDSFGCMCLCVKFVFVCSCEFSSWQNFRLANNEEMGKELGLKHLGKDFL